MAWIKGLTAAERLEEEARMEKVYKSCQLEEGVYVRGTVPRIDCFVCGNSRLEDGTPCGRCGAYPRAVRLHMMGLSCSYCRDNCRRNGVGIAPPATRFRFGVAICDSDGCHASAMMQWEERSRRKERGLLQ